MKYNICIVSPPGYIHAHAFDELAVLVGASLRDLGYSVSIRANHIDPEFKNIIIGCHLLDPSFASHLPKNCIILNTEQLSPEIGSWNQNIMFWLQEYEAWDYSQKNIEYLKNNGLPEPKYLILGYNKALEVIVKSEIQDVDVLFYGSLNERRKKIIDELNRKGLVTKCLFGVYGVERDKWIERSKVILNIHYFETKIFEIVRCFYPMINGKAIVSEFEEDTSIDRRYIDAIQVAPYEDIVGQCINLCCNSAARKQLEIAARSTIKKYPQTEIIKSLLI